VTAVNVCGRHNDFCLYTKFVFVLLMMVGAVQQLGAAELTFNTQEFAPFNYSIGGVVSGPVVEVVSTVCTVAKIKCRFKSLPWRRAQADVKTGKANGMFVIGWNKERAKWLNFSPPILNTEYGFFVRNSNNLEFREISDIAGYSIGVYGPSNTSNSLEKIKSDLEALGADTISIDLRPYDETGFRKLSLGRVDAVYSNRDVGVVLTHKLGLKNVRYAGSQKRLKYYVGFSKAHTDKALVDRFNAAFNKLHAQGAIQKILVSYGMEPSAL